MVHRIRLAFQFSVEVSAVEKIGEHTPNVNRGFHAVIDQIKMCVVAWCADDGTMIARFSV